ncbi:MAG TPA: hypothetical protein VFE72_02840 [Lysobacter sp.]|nr:hypothetical protein [Lysobacter sp.]
MARVLVLGALLSLLAGVPAAQAVVSPLPEPPAVLVEALPAPRPPACVRLLSPRAYDLVLAFETGGRRTYERKYQRPVWPGGASGATIGIGYDLGHARAPVILLDWAAHPQRGELPRGAGVKGEPARAVTRSMQHVVTPLPLAERVFSCTSVITYWRITKRAFGPGFLELPPNAQGALVSLVYNRGGGMKGPTRTEMAEIRDVCIPAQDVGCIARLLRAMKRVWRGTTIEAGMNARRDAEAALALAP